MCPQIWLSDSLTIQVHCTMIRFTDYGRPESKQPSLHGRKFTPTPKFLGTAKAYFVCYISPIFQISLIYAFIGCPQSVAERKGMCRTTITNCLKLYGWSGQACHWNPQLEPLQLKFWSPKIKTSFPTNPQLKPHLLKAWSPKIKNLSLTYLLSNKTQTLEGQRGLIFLHSTSD